MRVSKIEKIGKLPVYDIMVDDKSHYILENGVVTHNSGLMYSANQAFIIGKSQEKDGTELVGWNFTINTEKSRFVREKAKMPFRVMYGSGIQKYSGLLDLALESKLVIKPSMGWYSRVDEDGVVEDRKWRAKDTDTAEFWGPMLVKESKFCKWIESRFKLTSMTDVSDESLSEFAGEEFEEE